MTKMLTVVCFVFREKAGGVSDENADCGVLCVQGKGRMLTLVCFVFRGKARGGSDEDADRGVLCLRGHHHPIGHTGLLQDTHTRLPPFRSMTFLYTPHLNFSKIKY